MLKKCTERSVIISDYDALYNHTALAARLFLVFVTMRAKQFWVNSSAAGSKHISTTRNYITK